MNVEDYTSIFDRVLERMDKLSTWRFVAVWLIFFLLAAGYFCRNQKNHPTYNRWLDIADFGFQAT